MSDCRRQEFLRVFANQKILLLGLVGAGKSSLINSFFFVASGEAEEVEDIGYKPSRETRSFVRHSCRHPDKQTSVTFLDSIGFPPYGGFKAVLTDLLHGRIRLNSDLMKILSTLIQSDFDVNTYLWAKTSTSEEQKQCQPSAVVTVLDATAPLPEFFLEDVQEVIRNSCLPVFVIATRKDQLETSQLTEFEKEVKTLLPDCSGVYFLSTYLPHEDLKKYPINKQNDLMDAFVEILNDGKGQAEELASVYN
eukprot:m.122514 g.122514  ORF g.122514 m.122514 type:complete len:250 (+) comp37790_c0_seq1:27-776(+)